MVNKDFYDGYREIDKISKHIDEEWEISNCVGSGGFSRVYKAKKLNGVINGNIVGRIYTAIKVIERNKFEFNEINILKSLNQHSFIAKFYGLGKDEKFIYVYMEYIYGISISDKLKQCEGKFPEHEIHIILKSLVDAIYFIHQNKIIHRDIKGDNILLDKNDIRVIRLIDFGLSKQYEESSRHHSVLGTYLYMSPEVRMQTNKAGRKSDIWSLGCTIIEMAGGDLNEKDENGIPKIPNHLSQSLINFIQNCLIINPDGRADIMYLKKHKYLNQSNNEIINNNNSLKNYKNLNETLKPPSSPNMNHDIILLDSQDSNSKDDELKLPEIKERLGSNSILNIDSECLLPALQKPNESRRGSPANVPLPSLIHKYLPGATYDQPLTPGCIPSTLEELVLPKFNQTIAPGCIPSNIGKLVIPSFNRLLEPFALPDSITSIILDSFNQPLEKNCLPNKLTKLSLPSYDHPLLIGSIPHGIVDLKLGKFNHQLSPKVLPTTIKRLSLPMFNQILHPFCIPSKVEFLKLKSFNQPIENDCFPSSIKELILPSFNQVLLPGYVPDSVYYILLSSFNQMIIPECLPNSIENIVDMKSFNQMITPHCIPELVEELILASFNQPLVPKCFPNLRQLDLAMFNQPLTKDCLPDTIEHLSLFSFNQIILPGTFPKNVSTLLLASFNQEIKDGYIPTFVEKLSLRDFNQEIPIGSLPSSIKVLILGRYNQPLIPGSIPSSVTHLVLSDYNQPLIEGSIPHSVTKLYFENFNQDLDSDSIPDSVLELDLGNQFHFQDYSSNLPFNITTLKCNYQFLKPLRRRDIPSSVTELILGNYNLSIPSNTIPKSVVSLTLGLVTVTNCIKSLKNIPSSVINLSLDLHNNNNNNSNNSCTCSCSDTCCCNNNNNNIINYTEVVELLKQNLVNNIVSIKLDNEEIILN